MWQGSAPDLRYALPRLAHNTPFTLLVVMILAPEIGAYSAKLNVVDASPPRLREVCISHQTPLFAV